MFCFDGLDSGFNATHPAIFKHEIQLVTCKDWNVGFFVEISDIGGAWNDIGHQLLIGRNISKIAEILAIYWRKIERGVTHDSKWRRAQKIADISGIFWAISSLHQI